MKRRGWMVALLGVSLSATAWGQGASRLDERKLLELRLPDVQIESAVAVNREEQASWVPYVDVKGVIGGSIHFQLLLPDDWNGRLMMGGGGGFVGRVQIQLRRSVNSGYAVVGTDTGHQTPAEWPGASWALDDMEALVNFGHLAVHRTAEVSKAIIYAYYGVDPSYSYFVGCSTGGGQALMAAQRYPGDFDGIVSMAPALDWTGIAAAKTHEAQVMYPNGRQQREPVVGREDVKRLYEEIMKQCDGQDGLEDGIIDDPRAVQFDLSKVQGLTKAQREAIQAIYDGPYNANGQIYPGIALGGEGEVPGRSAWFQWITGPVPRLRAQADVPTMSWVFGTEIFRYFVFHDPEWDYTTYDFSSWAKDTHLAGTILNATDPNLSSFREHGGKLILVHGWADAELSPLRTVQYYEEVLARDPAAKEYSRLFLLPGVMHCGAGPGPDQVDWLAVIADWTERSTAPERLIATKRTEQGEVVMTRPIYSYPQRAAYSGSGDPNKAENFVLRRP